MKAKHTPGPWSYTQAFMSSWDIRRPDGTQMYFLGASTSIEKGEHEANARLIAASPDLLEALECVVCDLLMELHVRGIRGDKWHSLIAARAAISKATGEES